MFNMLEPCTFNQVVKVFTFHYFMYLNTPNNIEILYLSTQNTYIDKYTNVFQYSCIQILQKSSCMKQYNTSN